MAILRGFLPSNFIPMDGWPGFERPTIECKIVKEEVREVPFKNDWLYREDWMDEKLNTVDTKQ